MLRGRKHGTGDYKGLAFTYKIPGGAVPPRLEFAVEKVEPAAFFRAVVKRAHELSLASRGRDTGQPPGGGGASFRWGTALGKSSCSGGGYRVFGELETANKTRGKGFLSRAMTLAGLGGDEERGDGDSPRDGSIRLDGGLARPRGGPFARQQTFVPVSGGMIRSDSAMSLPPAEEELSDPMMLLSLCGCHPGGDDDGDEERTPRFGGGRGGGDGLTSGGEK